MSATINGQDVGDTSSGNPVRLDPGESVDVAVELTNHGPRPSVSEASNLPGAWSG